MLLPRVITDPAIRMLSAGLHASPLKTRLGGVSTLTAWLFGLRSRTEIRTARLRNGIALPVRLSDYNGRMLYLFGTPDPKVVEVCRSLLRPGDVFLDIGANFGSVGLLCHDAVLPGGSVHFVEPQPDLAVVIRDAAASLPAESAQVHNCGLWDSDTEMTLSIPDNHTGAASMVSGAKTASTVTVPVRAVESFLAQTVGDSPFGAKVDVEGAEPRILPAILAHHQLRFVLFECNSTQVKDRVWELAGQHGLAYFGLNKKLFTVQLRAIRSRNELNAVHDVVAVRIATARAPTGDFHPKKLVAMMD